MRSFFAAVIFWVLTSPACFSQSQAGARPMLQSFGGADGLPLQSVYQISIDANNAMLICGSEGVWSWNGTECKPIHFSLPENSRIVALFSRVETTWIVLGNATVWKQSGSQLSQEYANDIGDTVTAVHMSADELLVGSASGRVLSVGDTGLKVLRTTGPPVLGISGVDDQLRVSTKAGLESFSGGRWRRIKTPDGVLFRDIVEVEPDLLMGASFVNGIWMKVANQDWQKVALRPDLKAQNLRLYATPEPDVLRLVDGDHQTWWLHHEDGNLIGLSPEENLQNHVVSVNVSEGQWLLSETTGLWLYWQGAPRVMQQGERSELVQHDLGSVQVIRGTDGWWRSTSNQSTDTVTLDFLNRRLDPQLSYATATDGHKLFVGSNFGVSFWRPGTDELRDVPGLEKQAVDQLFGNDSGLYVSYRDGRLLRWQEGGSTKEVGTFQAGVSALLLNEELWVATKNSEIYKGSATGPLQMIRKCDQPILSLEAKTDKVFAIRESSVMAMEAGEKVAPELFLREYVIDDSAFHWPEDGTPEIIAGELLLDFELISLAHAQHVRAEYRFADGGTWQDLPRREPLVLPPLPPGNHCLETRIVVDGAILSADGYCFTTIPPWYEGWPFRIALAFLVVGIFFLWLRLRTRKLKRDKARLEAIVEQRTRELKAALQELQESVDYAVWLQSSMIPSAERLATLFPQSLLFFRPKDKVSGDFWWATPLPKSTKIILTVADCTGHGVPGAMVSMLGSALLYYVAKNAESSDPGRILNQVRDDIGEALSNRVEGRRLRDGMDITFAIYDPETMELQVAAGNNSLLILRDKALPPIQPTSLDESRPLDKPLKQEENEKWQLTELPADRQSVSYSPDKSWPFRTLSVQLMAGDQLILFTDGFPDQFGGSREKYPGGKKFKYRPFKKLWLSIADEPLSQQKEQLAQAFDSWRGDFDQIDDVCVVSVKV